MKLLADENVDRAIVGWLRSQGHDASWMAELDPGASDQSVGALALLENRVLITFDRDFGEMVFRHGVRIAGVLFVRVRSASVDEIVSWFSALWPRVESQLAGHFVIATRTRIRIRPIMPLE